MSTEYMTQGAVSPCIYILFEVSEVGYASAHSIMLGIQLRIMYRLWAHHECQLYILFVDSKWGGQISVQEREPLRLRQPHLQGDVGCRRARSPLPLAESRGILFAHARPQSTSPMHEELYSEQYLGSWSYFIRLWYREGLRRPRDFCYPAFGTRTHASSSSPRFCIDRPSSKFPQQTTNYHWGKPKLSLKVSYSRIRGLPMMMVR